MPQHGAGSRAIAENAYAMRIAEERRADPAMQLMVDEMILDYLLYMASKVILQDRKAQIEGVQPSAQESRADLHLSMVDAFLTIFKANHPGHVASVGMQFRLCLLQFTTILLRRASKGPSTPSSLTLGNIRCQNRARACVWLSHIDSSSTSTAQTKLMLRDYDTALPLSKATLVRNREHISAILEVKSNPSWFYGLPQCPSLLDSLPAFMALSAAQVAMISSTTVTREWMSLAARYMTQSVLEQYLIYGEHGSEPLLEAFAWGFDAGLVADASSDERRINAMFWDKDDEVGGWEYVRDIHMRNFIPEPGESIVIHLENLAVKYPLNEFEDDVVTFLEALLVCQAKPILAQMEAAELNELSRLQTDLLKQRIGFMD